MKRAIKHDAHAAAARATCAAGLALTLILFPLNAHAQGPERAPEVLSKTRKLVVQFVEDFGSLRYEEDISQQKLKDNDRVAYKQETVFDSIIRMHFEEGKLRVDEQRLLEKMPPHVESRPLLSTSGFSSLAMIFHPYYESSFRFARLQDDARNGKVLVPIHFEHLPGTPSPFLYQMVNLDRPLELNGTAWIDPATGEIDRIEAIVESSVSDMGVKSIHAVLVYGQIHLRDETEPHWLPVSATIDLETPRQHWRNIHRFTDYRMYRVTTNIPGVATQ